VSLRHRSIGKKSDAPPRCRKDTIDRVLTEITERMEATMRCAGVTVEELMDAPLVARAKIAHEEFREGT
jgi:hypothetical protein